MLKRLSLILCGAVFLLALGAGTVWAGDKVTGREAEKVRKSIESYVKRDTALKGGFFVYDAKKKKVLSLEYDHVHKGVEKTGSGEYFACVDFVDADKNSYDIDIYVGNGDGKGDIRNIVLHKVNGEDRLAK